MVEPNEGGNKMALSKIKSKVTNLVEAKKADITKIKNSINALKKEIEAIRENIKIAEQGGDAAKYLENDNTLKAKEKELVFYENHLELTESSASLTKEEANKILAEAVKIVKAEDEKNNKEAVLVLERFKKVADNSRQLFSEQESIRTVLKELCLGEVLNSPHINHHRADIVFDKISSSELAQKAGAKEMRDSRKPFFLR